MIREVFRRVWQYMFLLEPFFDFFFLPDTSWRILIRKVLWGGARSKHLLFYPVALALISFFIYTSHMNTWYYFLRAIAVKIVWVLIYWLILSHLSLVISLTLKALYCLLMMVLKLTIDLVKTARTQTPSDLKIAELLLALRNVKIVMRVALVAKAVLINCASLNVLRSSKRSMHCLLLALELL